MDIPYTTRDTDGDFKLALNYNLKGWKTPSGSAEDSLKNLSIDLPKVDDNVKFSRSDISVPSPWATIISFDIILNNTDEKFGALRKKANREWRSLLALVALRDVLKLNLKYRIIDLAADGKNDAERDFYKNLINMKPKKSAFENGDCWNKFIFIELDNYPIGVFSNSTLVCSLNKYVQNSAVDKLVKIGLMDSSYNMVDPVDWIEKDMALSLYLQTWLENIKKSLNTAKEQAENKAEMEMGITNVIDEFINDLNSAYIDEEKSKYDKLKDSLFTFEYKAEKAFANAYELLWHTELTLLNMSTEEVIDVIKIKDLKNICFLDALGKNLAGFIKENKDICRLPEDWKIYDTDSVFLDELYLVKTVDDKDKYSFDNDIMGTCIIEDNTGDKPQKIEYQYILPVRDIILADINASIIRKTIKVTEGIDDEIVVSLDLEGEDGNKIPIEKHYAKSDCKKLYNADIPHTTIWPYVDIKNPDGTDAWKEFYIFCSKKSKGSNSKYSYTIEAKSNDYNMPSRSKKLSNIKDNVERTVSYINERPTYLIIKENTENLVGEIFSRAVGIILLPEPSIAKTLDKNINYVVGFDFGTTASTAFCKRIEEDGVSQPMFVKFGEMFSASKSDMVLTEETQKEFENGTYIGNNDNGLLIAYNNRVDCQRPAVGKSKWDSESDICFVPTRYPYRKSYGSVYNVNSTENIEPTYSLMHGNVIFDQKLLSYIDEINIKRTLKWGREPSRQKNLARYLNQMLKTVALTLAKERAGKIRWKFSYPTSLTAAELKRYKDLTKNIIKDINEKTGIDCDSTIDYCPESFASAKFFRDSKKYICVDIGGGSTDVSVWKESIGDNNLGNIMQYSIGIASRKIFLAGITDAILCPEKVNENHNSASYNDIQEEIKKRLDRDFCPGYSSCLQNCLDKIAKANRLDDATDTIEKFSYLVESLLQADDNDIKTLIGENSNVRNKFVQLMLIGFWGILYYLAKSLVYVEKSLEGITTLDINFAGNGSKVYTWLEDIDETDYIPLLEKAFALILNKSFSDTDKKINIKFHYVEENLKTETAIGLLETLNDFAGCETNVKLINGSDCLLKYPDGQEKSFKGNEEMGTSLKMYYDHNDETVNGASLKIPNLREDLEDFIAPMNECIFAHNNAMKINIDDELISEVEGYVGTVIHNNIVSGSIAPAFIVELEALISAKLGYLKRKNG